jgi:hypothetical protein
VEATAVSLVLLCAVGVSAQEPPALPDFDPFGEPYRTPLSGEGFRFELFGEPREVTPRDRFAGCRRGRAAALRVALLLGAPERG